MKVPDLTKDQQFLNVFEMLSQSLAGDPNDEARTLRHIVSFIQKVHHAAQRLNVQLRVAEDLKLPLRTPREITEQL
jgi:hypothetical protein